jgi:hypothetical protein
MSIFVRLHALTALSHHQAYILCLSYCMPLPFFFLIFKILKNTYTLFPFLGIILVLCKWYIIVVLLFSVVMCDCTVLLMIL